MTHLFAGAETSGLYRLSPGSEQWEELTVGLPESPSVCGIVSPYTRIAPRSYSRELRTVHTAA